MSDDTHDTDATANPESGSSELDTLLADKFGDDFTSDDLQAYQQDRSAWTKQQNRHNQEAATSAQEASAARDQLLQSLSAQNSAPPAPQQQAGPTQSNPDEFFKTLGLTSPDDVMTGRQGYAVWKGASDYMEASNQVYAKKFAEQESELGNLRDAKQQFEATQQAFAQYLADERVGELTDKYPDADRDAIIRAIRDTEPGDSFDFNVDQAAKSSHEHIGNLVGAASQRETKRRASARKNRFTGSGESGAAAGKKMPSLRTSEGIAAFMQRFPVDGGGDDPI